MRVFANSAVMLGLIIASVYAVEATAGPVEIVFRGQMLASRRPSTDSGAHPGVDDSDFPANQTMRIIRAKSSTETSLPDKNGLTNAKVVLGVPFEHDLFSKCYAREFGKWTCKIKSSSSSMNTIAYTGMLVTLWVQLKNEIRYGVKFFEVFSPDTGEYNLPAPCIMSCSTSGGTKYCTCDAGRIDLTGIQADAGAVFNSSVDTHYAVMMQQSRLASYAGVDIFTPSDRLPDTVNGYARRENTRGWDIDIRDTKMTDSRVVSHEWGHIAQYQLNADVPLASGIYIGPYYDASTHAAAVTEGWADFVALATYSDRTEPYIDNRFAELTLSSPAACLPVTFGSTGFTPEYGGSGVLYGVEQPNACHVPWASDSDLLSNPLPANAASTQRSLHNAAAFFWNMYDQSNNTTECVKYGCDLWSYSLNRMLRAWQGMTGSVSVTNFSRSMGSLFPAEDVAYHGNSTRLIRAMTCE